MKQWQVEIMEENAEKAQKEFRESLSKAVEHISAAWDLVYQAADAVEGSPLQMKVESFQDELITLMNGLEALKDKL